MATNYTNGSCEECGHALEEHTETLGCYLCECDCHEYKGEFHCMWCHPVSKPERGIYVNEN